MAHGAMHQDRLSRPSSLVNWRLLFVRAVPPSFWVLVNSGVVPELQLPENVALDSKAPEQLLLVD